MSLHDQRKLSPWLTDFIGWLGNGGDRVVTANYLDRIRLHNEERQKQNTTQYGCVEDALKDFKERTGLNAYAQMGPGQQQDMLEELRGLPIGAEEALLHDPNNPVLDTPENKARLRALKHRQMQEDSNTGYADAERDGAEENETDLSGGESAMSLSEARVPRTIEGAEGASEMVPKMFGPERLSQTLESIPGLPEDQQKQAIEKLREEWSLVSSAEWPTSPEHRALRMSRCYVRIFTNLSGKKTLRSKFLLRDCTQNFSRMKFWIDFQF